MKSKLPKKKLLARKSKSLSGLKKTLDSIFSVYIRTKYATNGMVKCYTCTTIKPIKEMQNGHYISRTNLATRFHEDNCRPQCAGCNIFNHGRLDVFTINLLREGVDLEELQRTKYSIFKVDRSFYEYKIKYYSDKIKELSTG